MPDRMTAAEVVAELREKAGYSHAAADFASGLLTSRTHAARSSAMTEAADLVEQHLSPQVLDEPKSRDRQALEMIVKSIVLNTRDHEKSTTGQLFFVVSKIRLMAEEIARLCEIETHDRKSTLPKSQETTP